MSYSAEPPVTIILLKLSLIHISKESDQCSGMVTTFTALSLCGNDVHIAHVGDSRAYLMRNGAIMRLTMDHTLVCLLYTSRCV